MVLDVQAQEAIKTIDTQIMELLAIRDSFKQRKISSADGLEKMGEWKVRTVELLSQKVHPNEGINLDKKNEWALSEDPLTSFRKTVELYISFLKLLKEKIEKNPGDIFSAPIAS